VVVSRRVEGMALAPTFSEVPLHSTVPRDPVFMETGQGLGGQ
jgi:hypothetical protein